MLISEEPGEPGSSTLRLREASLRKRREAKTLIRASLVLCAGFVLLVGPSADAAKPGALDTTFGRGGKVITDFGRIDSIYDIAVQPNGKIVAVGDSYERGTPNDTFALARYTRSGALDQTFGIGGKATTDFGRTSSGAFAVVLQPDGRMVAAGGAGGDIALARYDANGSLDPTFGEGGTVLTDLPSSREAALALLLQPDGKLVVSGSTRQFGSYADFLVARYTASGALDQSFGNGGIVSTDFQPGWTDYAFGVALGPGGKIVAAGVGLPGDAGGPGVIDIAVYDTNGHLDPSFDSDGMLVSAPELDSGAWGGVIAQPDGKVVIGGNIGLNAGLVRYTAGGALDRTFGIARNGVANASGGVSDLARQRDGKFVTAGIRGGLSETDTNFAIARFDRSGLPDRSFHGGEATTDFGAWDLAEAVALQPDGRIVVGGSTERLDNGITQSGDFALARYLGVPSCRVPNVIGRTLRAAKARISRANCRLGRVRHRASARAPRGRIVLQQPVAGTNLPNRGRVNLVVSLGRE